MRAHGFYQYLFSGILYDRENIRLLYRRKKTIPVVVKENWTLVAEMKCSYSIVSRGTERRRARYQAVCDGRFGYINIAKSAEKYWIRPLPHGVAGNHEESLFCLSANVETVAVARIQLIAASAFYVWRSDLQLDAAALIIGSGAVALGAAMELQRLGYSDVIINLNRPELMPLPWAPQGITIQQVQTNCRRFRLVIDAVGSQDSLKAAIDLCQPHGVIGLLGSPGTALSLDFYQVHRRGLKLIGLHELNTNFEQRQVLFNDVHQWIQRNYKVLAGLICTIHPGEKFQHLYPEILAQSMPFQIHGFQWSDG